MKRRHIAAMIEEDASSAAIMTSCLLDFNLEDLRRSLPEERQELRIAVKRFANLLSNFYRSQETLAKKCG